MLGLETILTPTEYFLLTRGCLAIFLGGLIGLQRELRHKDTGIRTMAFVMLGAFLFTQIGMIGNETDHMRVGAQIVSGIGFLGAGVILVNKQGILENVTTATVIWISAALGMLIAVQQEIIAIIMTLLVILVSNLPHIGFHPPEPGTHKK